MTQNSNKAQIERFGLSSTALQIAILGCDGHGLGTEATVLNSQPITIKYTDGTSQTILQNFSDWSSFANNTNESVAITTAYRDLQSGERQTGPFNLYLYKLPINSSKTVSSVLLTRNSNVVVLAISLK